MDLKGQEDGNRHRGSPISRNVDPPSSNSGGDDHSPEYQMSVSALRQRFENQNIGGKRAVLPKRHPRKEQDGRKAAGRKED